MRYNFDKCFEYLMDHEGGYVNNKNDPGGETNLGVTKRVYQDYCIKHGLDVKDMKELTEDDVKPIYLENYWQVINADALSSGLDWSVFDFAVNSGPGRAAKFIQNIVDAVPDGDIGPMTLAGIAANDPAKLINQMYERRQKFYEKLKTFEHFGKGWSRRNLETKEQAHLMAKG